MTRGSGKEWVIGDALEFYDFTPYARFAAAIGRAMLRETASHGEIAPMSVKSTSPQAAR